MLHLRKYFISDESENVATSLPITCTVSSQYSYSYQCSNARDGYVEPGEGHEWVAITNQVGEWIKVKKYQSTLSNNSSP